MTRFATRAETPARSLGTVAEERFAPVGALRTDDDMAIAHTVIEQLGDRDLSQIES
jgi:hypothetical protein